MTGPGVHAAGDRSVGSAAGWVITGDNNVVLTVDGRVQETVAVPPTAAEAGRLLFGPSRGHESGLVGSWLRPDAGVVAAQPRPETADLLRWCATGGGPLVRLVRGTGGQGKTHLAGRVCAQVREQGWLAGFVRLPPASWRTVSLTDLARPGATADRVRRQMRRVPELVAGIHALTASDGKALLVVDYAENVGPVVAELLEVIADAGADRLVRVLLLARTDQGWFRDLTDDHPLHDWVDPRPVVLAALSAGWDAARAGQVWMQAVEGFLTRALDQRLSVDPTLTHGLTQPARSFATTLDLYADALLTVLDSTTDAAGAARSGDAVAGVLAHERRQVASGLHAAGVDLNEVQRDWAVAAIALRSVTDMDEAARLLGRAPALGSLGEKVRRRIALRLHELYPDPLDMEVWQPPVPDRLTDSHLLDLAHHAPTTGQWCAELTQLCGSGDEQNARRTIAVLHRALSAPGAHPTALARVRAGIGALIRHHPQAYVATVAVIDPAGFADDLTATISDTTPLMPTEDVQALDVLLRGLGFATTRTAVTVAVSHRLVEHSRPHPGSSPDQLHAYAGELNNLSLRLGELGRREEALAAIEEAVIIRRRLADANPAVYLPDLAASVNNLSLRLGELGRREEGLAAIEEASTIRRRLADANPAAYLPNLALSLNNLSLRLGELGRHEEGLAASEEAVSAYRRLADANPAAYLLNLATSLNNLSLRLGELGQRKEGLIASEEAVSAYRRLAGANPAAYLPDLAVSVNNLSLLLGELGRREEGLAASVEAVSAYRRLADANPAAYLPDLATSLNNLSLRLGELGRREEGLAAIEEAVTIRRRLVDANPAAYLPDLAVSVNNLSLLLGELGRREEGLAASAEAVTIRRWLADANGVTGVAGSSPLASGHSVSDAKSQSDSLNSGSARKPGPLARWALSGGVVWYLPLVMLSIFCGPLGAVLFGLVLIQVLRTDRNLHGRTAAIISASLGFGVSALFSLPSLFNIFDSGT